MTHSRWYIYCGDGTIHPIEAADSTHYYFTRWLWNPALEEYQWLNFTAPKLGAKLMQAKPASYFTTQKHKGNDVDVKRIPNKR